MPAYLNALSGEGVHIVTANEYLAKRDAEWMGEIHRFLGLTVGCNVRALLALRKEKFMNVILLIQQTLKLVLII